MKRMITIRVLAVLLCLNLLALMPLSAQQRAAGWQAENRNSAIEATLGSSTAITTQQDAAKTPQGEEPGVKVLSSQVLEKTQAAKRFAVLSNSDQELQALSKHLAEQGYEAQTKPENYFGWDLAYQRKDGETAKVALLVQDYAKKGSKDPAAIGTISIAAGNRSDTYSFSVIAPEGNYEKAIEYKVDRESLKVEGANSFWSCFVNRVSSQCAGVCVGALGTCLATSGGSWVSYLGCLASRCGLCAARAFACCLCNCSWWCKWAVGCCRR
jgi:hypothetical protein